MDLLNLPAVHRAIQGLDETAILDLATSAAATESGGWFAQARAIGELQRRADYKDAAVVRYAKALGVGKTLAFELGRIDRKILLRRLLNDGDAATFPITARRFYSLALKLAPLVGKSPLAVLAVAEAEHAKDPKFSTRRLREKLGAPAAADPVRGLQRCLEKLGGLSSRDRVRYARAAKDPAAVVALAESAAEAARGLADAARARVGGAHG